uniref:Uncharacterized protein n=1 Tax=Labrus bergylta TaxID=56723 RepID=A0A3Q3F728_9LABR
MSSPTSTPGRKRGRNTNPSTPSSEGPTSPPSQRRRDHDSSTGDLMPMPTSPATDVLSPAAPQDTSLFSSPRPSGTYHPNKSWVKVILVNFSLIYLLLFSFSWSLF